MSNLICDSGEGVHYCGYPISELAEMDPEDVVYLLHNKELPTPEQSATFREDLARRASIPGDFGPIFLLFRRMVILWIGFQLVSKLSACGIVKTIGEKTHSISSHECPE